MIPILLENCIREGISILTKNESIEIKFKQDFQNETRLKNNSIENIEAGIVQYSEKLNKMIEEIDKLWAEIGNLPIDTKSYSTELMNLSIKSDDKDIQSSYEQKISELKEILSKKPKASNS